MKSKKLIIFDLDGVLMNSLSNMKIALKSTSKALNLKLDFSEYKKYLGLPFEDIMQKIGVNKNIDIIKKKYSFFSKKNLYKIRINQKHLFELKKLSKNYNLAVLPLKIKLELI